MAYLTSGSAAPAPLPENDETLHDLPAQGETKENHTRVPMPSIVAVSAKDPAKDRTIDSKSAKDTATTKPISNDPAVDPKRAKEDAQENPGLPGSSLQSSTVASTGTAVASPDATSSNVNAGQPARAPAPVHKDAPQPVTKDTPTSVPIAAGVAASPVAPATPGKVDGAAVSASSTPASTPAKSTHGRETSADGVKPKKSGFLQKVRHCARVVLMVRSSTRSRTRSSRDEGREYLSYLFFLLVEGYRINLLPYPSYCLDMNR